MSFKKKMKKEEAIEELRRLISGKMTFHWDEIQKILGEKEKGAIDINLDILMKIHNNSYQEEVEIYKKLNELFPKKNENRIRD